MSEFAADLENEITQDQVAKLRASILETLNGRNLTLEDLLGVVTSASKEEVRQAMKTLTLDELRATTPSIVPEEPVSTKGGGGSGGRKKSTKKKSTKKTAKKAAKKTPAKKTASGRVRQDYAQLTKEILSLMKKQGEPISTGLVTETFGVNGTTARKAMEILFEEGEVTRQGNGRGRVYEVVA